ncbi:signal peptidase I [Streptomyces sp. NPDC101118]|uniref:signal peptidase I n=1 Tax=Streptomyces sp. NPDC101118 TaxID=3366109 RepID=UPI003825D8D4
MNTGRRPGRRLGIAGVALLLAGVLLVGGAGAGALVAGQELVVKKYDISSDSMRPTLEPGEVQWFAMGGAEQQPVRRGDVVLVETDWVPDAPIAKRVVAVGGDRIAYDGRGGALTLNGRPLDEPYLMDPEVAATVSFDVTVPEGRVFLMGDNRGNSYDSSMHLDDEGRGSVPLAAVKGKAVDRPTGVIVAGGLMVLGVVVALVGGGLGTAALVLRRRAARQVPDVPVWVGP